MRWLRGSRLRFALPGVVALTTVALAYLLAHPYPALGGGLFLKMASAIAENGYGLPTRIPGYTGDGLPYGYPPLAAYLMAALLDAGVDPLAIARWLPTALLFATVPCYYLFAEAVLELRGRPPTTTRLQAAGATVVFVTTPAVLQYTLTAGGTIRAGALLVTAAGAAVGVRLFGRREYRLALPAAALFGVALLVHLKYALCFAVSYLFLYAYLDRTSGGLLRGAAVALGGFAVAAPWWVQVGLTHGFDIFLRASGTHGGIGAALWPVELLTPEANPPSLWPALIVVAGLFLLARGEYFLPLWTVIVGFVVGNDEHAVLIGALMVPVLLREAVRGSAAPERRAATGDDAAPAGDADAGSGSDPLPAGVIAIAGAVGSGCLRLLRSLAVARTLRVLAANRTAKRSGDVVRSLWLLTACRITSGNVVGFYPTAGGDTRLSVAGVRVRLRRAIREAFRRLGRAGPAGRTERTRRGERTDGGGSRSGSDGRFGAAPTVAVIVLLVGYGVGAAAAYAGSTERLPAYVDGDDVEAAEWVRSQTPPNATFVVIGDAAEWFPMLADRTSLVAARGSEWDGSAPYARQRQLRSELSECLSAQCVTGTLAGAGLYPDYVYLPRDGYVDPVHRTLAPLRWSLLRNDFERSPKYEIVYRNDGVAIARVADPPWLDTGDAENGAGSPTTGTDGG